MPIPDKIIFKNGKEKMRVYDINNINTLREKLNICSSSGYLGNLFDICSFGTFPFGLILHWFLNKKIK